MNNPGRPPTFKQSILLLTLSLVIAGSGCSTTSRHSAMPPVQNDQAAITPSTALERLKAGNKRFVEGTPLHRDLSAQRQASAKGQYPYAVVLSCLDSRCATEQVFDQGIGDVFSARVAGNVLNDDILGSMEFACKAAGAKLVAVVGHSKCGAVKGACANVELGHLTGLLQKIKPSVPSDFPKSGEIPQSKIDAVAAENVRNVVREITGRSPILADMVRQGQIGLVGGMYDLETGKVSFFE